MEKFDAKRWVDAVDAIPGIVVFVSEEHGLDAERKRLRCARDEESVSDEGRDQYERLAAEMRAAPDGITAVKAELLRRDRVLEFQWRGEA